MSHGVVEMLMKSMWLRIINLRHMAWISRFALLYSKTENHFDYRTADTSISKSYKIVQNVQWVEEKDWNNIVNFN